MSRSGTPAGFRMAAILFGVVPVHPASAQSVATAPVAAPAPAPPATIPVTIRAGTPIPLLTVRALSSKTAAKGDLFDLEVAQDVVSDGQVVVPKGTRGIGELTRAETSGALGAAGAIEARLLYLVLRDTTVRIEGFIDSKGKSSAGTVIAAFMITPIIKGGSATIPAGTAITGFVEHDVTIAR